MVVTMRSRRAHLAPWCLQKAVKVYEQRKLEEYEANRRAPGSKRREAPAASGSTATTAHSATPPAPPPAEQRAQRKQRHKTAAKHKPSPSSKSVVATVLKACVPHTCDGFVWSSPSLQADTHTPSIV